MSLFKFIIQNSSQLEKIFVDGDGTVELDVDEFDFGHSDVAVEVDNADIVFSIEVGVITCKCIVNITNITKACPYIQGIADVHLRETVIQMIEETYRSDAETRKAEAEEAVNDAQSTLNDASKDFDDIVDTLGNLKNSWNIP